MIYLIFYGIDWLLEFGCIVRFGGFCSDDMILFGIVNVFIFYIYREGNFE